MFVNDESLISDLSRNYAIFLLTRNFQNSRPRQSPSWGIAAEVGIMAGVFSVYGDLPAAKIEGVPLDMLFLF